MVELRRGIPPRKEFNGFSLCGGGGDDIRGGGGGGVRTVLVARHSSGSYSHFLFQGPRERFLQGGCRNSPKGLDSKRP